MSPRRDGGFTLAEVLVSVAILGITFVAIIGGLGTAIITSDIDRRQAIAQNTLRSLAEQVRAETYVACPSVPNYGSSYAVPATFTKTVAVEYWVPVGNTFVGTCPLNDGGLQRITITIATTDARVREPVVIFKRVA
jgi:prepilin-type N-terminal cleavage/methylation domain-containing protein